MIKKWCLFYVWLFRYLTIKFGELKSKEISINVINALIILYIGIYILIPLTVFYFKSSYIIKECRIVFLLLLIFPFLFKLPKKIKSKIDLHCNYFQSIKDEDWVKSKYYKKGKFLFLFHLIFPFISIIFAIVVGGELLKLFK
jgi:hypothetical protein